MAFGLSGTFNTGLDRTISIVNNSTGASVSLGGRRTDITARSKDDLLVGEGVDQGGLVDHAVLPSGIEGKITVDRRNGDLDRLKAYLDDNFFAGNGQVYFTIVSTTYNQYDKSTDKEQYEQVLFHNYDSGSWKRARVSPSVDFVAQRRRQIQ